MSRDIGYAAHGVGALDPDRYLPPMVTLECGCTVPEREGHWKYKGNTACNDCMRETIVDLADTSWGELADGIGAEQVFS